MTATENTPKAQPTFLKTFKADLHIHTCLSPCAELEMSPQAIAAKAQQASLDIIGICDHNTAENTPALIEAGREFGITVFPGIEVTTMEEVHILALFDDVESAIKLQNKIYAHLPGKNDADIFGIQAVVNYQGEVLDFNPRLLIGSSTLTLDEVVRDIHALQGLAIASHIDRDAFSLISQLGFIPNELDLDALEISPGMKIAEAINKYHYNIPFTQSSDAHCLKDIGRVYTKFEIEQGTITEIKKALMQKAGRKISYRT